MEVKNTPFQTSILVGSWSSWLTKSGRTLSYRSVFRVEWLDKDLLCGQN